MICWRRCLAADWYVAELYTAMVRFGMWDELLAEPAPDAQARPR